jgi:hypothetical protein
MTPRTTLPTLLRTGLALLVAILVAACATTPGSKTMTFSEADLTRLLEQHGPFQRRLLEVLDVRVQNPTMRLVPGSNRLASSFDVAATERVSRKTLSGRMAVEYGLRYDDLDKAIRLTQVRVNQFQLNDVPAEKKGGVQNLGTLIAEHMLDDAVLYRFRPADLKNAEGQGLKPGNVAVTSRGVEVTLAPVGR